MIKIYGKNCIYEAIRANHKIDHILVSKEIASKDQSFLKMLDDKKIKYIISEKKELDKNCSGSHQGYLAFAIDYEYIELNDLLSLKKEGRQIILLLDGINDPQNFGAILRSCDAFGILGVVIPKNRSVSVTDTVAHVSTGAIEYVNISMVNNLYQAILKLKENGYWIVGTDALGDKLPSEIDKNLNIAVIIGSEGFGISKLCKKECDYMVKIPMVGHVNSLNASVSTGIILASLK